MTAEASAARSGSGPIPTAFPAKSVVREYLETIVICVMFLIFARSFVFMQSKIPTGSMLETLQIGDYIMVNRFVYGGPDDHPLRWLGQRPIERGDVIVFRYPSDPDTDYVKRVVGLPGETIEIVAGQVLVDGEPLDEPYVKRGTRERSDNMSARRIPPGQYFVLGDNRNNSRDSRYWGTVPRPLVKGRAFLIWWSYEEPPNNHQLTGWRALASMAKKIVFFPVRTRWERLFSLVR